MKAYQFTLILSGVSEITPELADALYEATDGDIEFNIRDGVARLEVRRIAADLEKATASAVRDVENARVGIRVVGVET